jgi:hypothetical protein
MPNPADATIFMIGADNALTELEPSDFLNEDEFQQLLAAYPALLRLAAGADGALLLIAREAGVADQPGAADRWAVDHLFLNKEGVPVLVEVKRATDTRTRREVVAQMLDYASHGTRLKHRCKARRDPQQSINRRMFSPPRKSHATR